MVIPWTVKKQVMFFLIFAAIILTIIIFIIISLDKSSCIDGQKNQGEEGIDCGGPCKACVGEVKDLVILWSKVFKLSEGKYETAALVFNPNLSAGASNIKYKFNIYDEKNILITVKTGETSSNPDEKFLILEGDFDVGERIPKYSFLEITENPKWEKMGNEKPQLIVSKKQFLNTEPFPQLMVEIENQSLFVIENISLAAILYGKDQNAKAVSTSKITYIGGDSKKEVVFTWPEIFPEEPDSIEVLIMQNR